MADLFRCPCGQSLRVDDEHTGLYVRCPACGRTLILPPNPADLPDAETTASLGKAGLFVAAALALAIVVGIGLVLGLMLSGPDSSAPRSDVQAEVAREAPSPPAKAEPAPTDPVPASKPAEILRKPPTIAIVRAEPENPRAGEKLVLQLEGHGPGREPLQFQFRVSPSRDWQLAPAGRVQLDAVKPGTLTLEVRALDKDARPSEIIRKAWTVPPRFEVAEKPAIVSVNQGPFYQTVLIRRVSGYRALETDFRQGAQYSLVSRFEVEKTTSDGGLVVRQKVEAVQLTDADPALQAELNGLLRKIKGAMFRLTLNDRREVTRFDGEPDALKVLNGHNLLGGQTYILWSFLDKDGWKELAQLAFFQPEKPLKRGKKWSRPMTHQWGPLGSWSGRVGYAYVGARAGLERIDYSLDLAYKPPQGSTGGGLPFEIGRSEFRLGESGGHILFDPAKNRVTAAEERFQVRGRVPVNALGVSAVVDMEELQVFQVRISDENPLEREPPGSKSGAKTKRAGD